MRTLSVVFLAVALIACGDNNPVKSDGPVVKHDGPVVNPDGPIVNPDGPITKTDGPITKTDGPVVTSALQAVVNKVTLPAGPNDYTYDYDGTGKKNGLGGINGALKALNLQGFDFQSNIDYMLTEGMFLMLLDVQAKALTADAAMKLQAYQGDDLDSPPNPKDNFSGIEELGVKVGSPQNLILNGAIAASKMSVGPGTIVFPLPIGATPTTVSLVMARIEADLSSTPLSAMTNGKIYGAIPWTDIDTKLIPEMARAPTRPTRTRTRRPRSRPSSRYPSTPTATARSPPTRSATA
jgi:hypothetical protein